MFLASCPNKINNNQTKGNFHTEIPIKGSCLLHFGKFQNCVINHPFDVPISPKIVKFWFSNTLNSFWTTKNTFQQPTSFKWSKLSKMRKKWILRSNIGRKNTFLVKCVLNVPKCIQVGARPFFDKFSQKYGYLKGC